MILGLTKYGRRATQPVSVTSTILKPAMVGGVLFSAVSVIQLNLDKRYPQTKLINAYLTGNNIVWNTIHKRTHWI